MAKDVKAVSTATRIRAAVEVLRVQYAPLFNGNESGYDWRDYTDISEPVADLLAHMADSIECVEHLFDPSELQMPEYKALLALVARIEGAMS